MPRSTPQLLQDARMWASRRLVRSLAPPDWLSVNVTLRCNLSCVMCTTCYDAPELSLDELRRVVDEAADMGVRVFNPLGGEPLVRQDLEDLLDHAASRGMFVTLTTNGTLLRPERAARLARIRPEHLHVNLSLDGPEDAHDKVRGKGSFARAMAGYRALRQADLDAGHPVRTVRANVLLHRGNLHTFEDFLAWLEAEGFSGVQQLTLFRNDQDADVGGMWFREEDLPALTGLCARLAADKAAGRGPARLLTNAPDDLRRVPRYFREGLTPLEAPCWAGWKELYVNADGAVQMCDGKLDFVAGRFGSVREQSLRAIWDSPALAERRKVVKSCTTPCIQGCYLRHESDHARPIARGLAQNALQPVRARARRLLSRLRPPRELGATLVFEVCAIPLDIVDPRFLRAVRFMGREGTPLPQRPPPAALDLASAALSARALDTTSGFGGEELLRKCLDDLEAAGLRPAGVHLGWRGEAGLHPDLGRLVALVRARGLPVGTDPHEELARLHGVTDARANAPEGAVLVITWDARVLASLDDHRQQRILGNAWEEDLAGIAGRLEAP